MGDRHLRKLLVVGACATPRHRKGHQALRLSASGMLERKTVKYKIKLAGGARQWGRARRLRADDEGQANTTTGQLRPDDRRARQGVCAAKAISI
jgi:hypothetical protein